VTGCIQTPHTINMVAFAVLRGRRQGRDGWLRKADIAGPKATYCAVRDSGPELANRLPDAATVAMRPELAETAPGSDQRRLLNGPQTRSCHRRSSRLLKRSCAGGVAADSGVTRIRGSGVTGLLFTRYYSRRWHTGCHDRCGRSAQPFYLGGVETGPSARHSPAACRWRP